MRPAFVGFVRLLRVVTLLATLAPLAAGAVATNVKATTPEGGDFAEQIIIVDVRTDQEVARKDKDDPDRRRAGFWIFELSEGSYYARNASGGKSQPFQVKSPGPVNVNVVLPSAAAAAGTTAGAVGFLFDLEGGYGYTSTGYDSWASIDNIFSMGNRLGPASDGFHINTNGGYLAGRIYPPFELSPTPSFSIRPFVEVTGQAFGSQTKDGAQFGVPGMTTLNGVEFQRQSSVGFGLGTRFAWDCGPVEFGVLPTVDFQWDMGRFRQTIDETLFLPNALVDTNKSLTTSNVVLGGNIQIKPSKDCGFYFFAGGGWKQPLNGDSTTITGQTPGGFDTFSKVNVNGGWQAQTGVGWQFKTGNLGF